MSKKCCNCYWKRRESAGEARQNLKAFICQTNQDVRDNVVQKDNMTKVTSAGSLLMINFLQFDMLLVVSVH